ncbi:MAG: tryptophan synthase beta subunit-like PLP-dependent enzyme, partial [Olpidium bornovanus]
VEFSKTLADGKKKKRQKKTVRRDLLLLSSVNSVMADRARFGYRSTRGGVSGLGFEDAVMAGLAPDGGLLVPEAVPAPPEGFLRDWRDLSYQDLALNIFSLFVPEGEICRGDLRELIARSYAAFTHDPPTPLQTDALGEGTHVLELFHGPTLAFKDVALQFLGTLFEYFLERRNARHGSAGRGAEVMTVVNVTSLCGDGGALLLPISGKTDFVADVSVRRAGSAAIYGLRGKRNVSVFILHPRGRVSPVQEAQMTTLFDKNVHNLAIEGTFDDCQVRWRLCG